MATSIQGTQPRDGSAWRERSSLARTSRLPIEAWRRLKQYPALPCRVSIQRVWEIPTLGWMDPKSASCQLNHQITRKISSNKCARAFGHWLTRCALSMHSDVCGASLGVQWWWPWHRNTDWRLNELSDHNLVAVSTTYFSTLICLMCSATKAQPSKDLQICTKGSLPGSDPSKFPEQHF